MDPLFDFTGKVVPITSDSRGLGLAMARAFAERGANLIIASRKLENREKVAAELEGLGIEARVASCGPHGPVSRVQTTFSCTSIILSV